MFQVAAMDDTQKDPRLDTTRWAAAPRAGCRPSLPARNQASGTRSDATADPTHIPTNRRRVCVNAEYNRFPPAGIRFSGDERGQFSPPDVIATTPPKRHVRESGDDLADQRLHPQRLLTALGSDSERLTCEAPAPVETGCCLLFLFNQGVVRLTTPNVLSFRGEGKYCDETGTLKNHHRKTPVRYRTSEETVA
ncbi:hypothetical protein EVAR_11188_1 [Eumeta japonica]|uniref:Uncharacterized protein n=1 Tax=Eumeta variegata TaxID=151549 RepID=A0A4C1U4W0_EUMVA|nr:hypothetical protein EVAR_11188_1 [Eumeta japonica]